MLLLLWETPFSHLEIACADTPIFAATSSWVSPRVRLCSRSFSPKICILSILFPPEKKLSIRIACDISLTVYRIFPQPAIGNSGNCPFRAQPQVVLLPASVFLSAFTQFHKNVQRIHTRFTIRCYTIFIKILPKQKENRLCVRTLDRSHDFIRCLYSSSRPTTRTVPLTL